MLVAIEAGGGVPEWAVHVQSRVLGSPVGVAQLRGCSVPSLLVPVQIWVELSSRFPFSSVPARDAHEPS